MSVIRCPVDNRPISGADMAKAVAAHRTPGGEVVYYGADREAGKPLWLGGSPEGPMVSVYHYRCFMAMIKAKARKDGSVVLARADVYRVVEDDSVTAALAQQRMLVEDRTADVDLDSFHGSGVDPDHHEETVLDLDGLTAPPEEE